MPDSPGGLPEVNRFGGVAGSFYTTPRFAIKRRFAAMPIIIQAFFDYVCPYCHLFEVALQRVAVATGAEVVRRAYQLNQSDLPKLDPRGERTRASWESSVYPMAEKICVEIRQPSRLPPTRLAHEAAAWARQQGCFERFHSNLFQAYFVEDKDLSELSLLKEIAWKSGLNPNELEKSLIEHRLAEEVDEDLLIAQTYGVTSVPTLVVAGHMLRGIQEEAVVINAIELARAGRLDAETRKLPHLPITISR
jgi:predicted DsbA family dithiol-disulfide isomerase